MKTLTSTVDGTEVRWRDKKRYLWMLGLIVPLLPYGAANWVRDSGWTGFYFAGPVFILLIILHRAPHSHPANEVSLRLRECRIRSLMMMRRSRIRSRDCFKGVGGVCYTTLRYVRTFHPALQRIPIANVH